MFEVLNITHLFDINLRVTMSLNGKSEDFVQSQYSTLTKQQVQGLYDIYKHDFEAFEYDYKDFFDIAVDGILPKPETIKREAEQEMERKEKEEAKEKEKAEEEKRKRKLLEEKRETEKIEQEEREKRKENAKDT